VRQSTHHGERRVGVEESQEGVHCREHSRVEESTQLVLPLPSQVPVPGTAPARAHVRDQITMHGMAHLRW